MEGNLNFVLKLSLEEMALRKVVVNLWNENDVLAMIQKFGKDDFLYYVESHIRDSEEWRENIEKRVKDKVLKLNLPESLKKRMMPIVRLIGYQIISWKIFHEQFDACLFEQVCWLSSGKIDYKNTSELIVSLETIDVTNRYKLACLYCLEDHIRVIWNKLPEESKKNFCDKFDKLFDIGDIPLDIYWSFILKRGDSALDNIYFNERFNVSSFNQRAFLNSACAGNKSATEYFFQKLKNEERDYSLPRVASFIIQNRIYSIRNLSDFPTEKLSDVLFYLIDQMSLQEKMQIIQRQAGGILNCLLDWPWQDILLETADFIWTFLGGPESEYYVQIYEICDGIRNTAFNFPKLFQEFFLRSPRYFRKEFVRFLDNFKFSCDSLTDTIKSILRDTDVEDRAELVSSYGFFKHLMALIANDEWQTVETYLQEVKLSKEDIRIVKEAFGGFIQDDGFSDVLGRNTIVERLYQLFEKTASHFEKTH